MNSLTIKNFNWSGIYFKNVPVSIRAIARPGYKFVRWTNNQNDNTDEHAGIKVTLKQATTYTAIFEPDNSTYNSVVINEINFKSADDYDTKDWIELYNTTSAAINLSKWKISNGFDEYYTIPAGTIIPPYGYLVVCVNPNKLFKFNPGLQNVVGDLNIELEKTEKIQLYDLDKNLIDEVEYNSNFWPDANGNGYTLALTDPFADNVARRLWLANDMHGTPGSENGGFNPSHTDFSISDNSYSVDVEDEPVTYVQAICYPNPFRFNATIVWEQSAYANVAIELYAASGLKLATIANDQYEPGIHQSDISHITGNLASGLYFAKISIDGQKPIILKIMKQ